MGRFYCEDCGKSLGLRFGLCHNCTPRKVTAARELKVQAEQRALRKWERKTEQKRKAFIEKKTRKESEEYYSIFFEAYFDRFRRYHRDDPRKPEPKQPATKE